VSRVAAVADVRGAAAGQIAWARRRAVREEGAGLRAGLGARRDVLLDPERSIGRDARGQIDIVLRQARVSSRVVLLDLGRVGRRGPVSAVDTLPVSVKLVSGV